jgi:hypothetical protein
MKTQILVPKSKTLLDVLTEMGERTKSAWIFINDNVFINLVQTADYIVEYDDSTELGWDDSEVIIRVDPYVDLWIEIDFIHAAGISFVYRPVDPDEVLFISMEE